MNDMPLRGLCVSLLCAIASNAPAAEFPPANLDFEKGSTGWTIPPSLWRIEPGAGRGGSAALVWENSNAKAYTFPQCPFAVEPGATYRYGAWVKVDSATTKGKPVAPKVSIDYANAAGEWIGAEYARAVSAPDADGWVRYEGETAPVPATVARGNIFGFVPKGATGKVRFDDFTIEKTGTRLIDMLVTSAYRNEADDGEVSFVATLFLDPKTTPLDSLAPVFAFTDPDGAKTEVVPTAFDAAHAAISIDVSLLAPAANPVAFILRTREGRELARAEIAFTRGCAPRRVAFDRFGRTLVDGRPFFPLGMYARDITPETLALYTNGAPWNCVMPYHAPDRDMLDLCDASGLMVMYSVKDIVFGAQFAKPPYSTSRKASLAEISRRAEAVRDHPAVLAYYANDEAQPRQAGILREVGDLLHRTDPDHPVWHVTDKEYKIRPMLGSFDVIGTDPYPVGLEARSKERSSIGEVVRISRAARDEMFGLAPVWQVVQAFDWSWDKRWTDEFQRFPTQEEISSMTWQAIAAGANGIVYYAFHRLCMGAPPEKRDEYLRRVADAGAEVRDVMPVLLSEPGPAVLSVPDGAACRAWRTGSGETTLLAANATRGEVKGSVTLDGGISVDISLPPLGHVLVTVAATPKANDLDSPP